MKVSEELIQIKKIKWLWDYVSVLEKTCGLCYDILKCDVSIIICGLNNKQTYVKFDVS